MVSLIDPLLKCKPTLRKLIYHKEFAPGNSRKCFDKTIFYWHFYIFHLIQISCNELIGPCNSLDHFWLYMCLMKIFKKNYIFIQSFSQICAKYWFTKEIALLSPSTAKRYLVLKIWPSYGPGSWDEYLGVSRPMLLCVTLCSLTNYVQKQWKSWHLKG